MLHKSIIIFFLFFACFPVFANEQGNFDIAASEIMHIEDGNKIIASGDVEIRYLDYILKTDKLTYIIDEEKLLSEDDVIITYKNGDEITADMFDISKNLHDITAQNFKMMFASGAHFKAQRVKKKDNKEMRLKYASFSSCKSCTEENRPLIWEAKANNITYDQEDKTIEYKNLWLEMLGVPVFYLPYFYHPDPSVKRKTGFLFPSIGSQSDIGEYIETPFFINISETSDLTLSPKFPTQHDPILSGLYRHNFRNGFLNLGGMITNNDDHGTRGQIILDTAFDINDNWRTKINYEQVSDDTVLKYYDLVDDERAWIESQASIERFSRNSNLSLNILSFQDLRADVIDSRIPDIIPYFEYNKIFNNLAFGSYAKLHTNILDMERDDEYNSTRRIATTFEYTKPYLSPFGALFNLSAFAAANIYSIDNYEYEEGKTFSGTKGFIIPNLIMETRYPFANKQENSYNTIEPVVQVILAPNSRISDKIPNEDSLDFEFEDSSVIQQNHFSGYDRYDIGSRINYGVNWSNYGITTGKTSLFVGQSFRFTDTAVYPTNSGFDDEYSDIVGSLTINPSDKLFADFRFRLNSHSLQSRHNEITLAAGPPIFRVSLDYLFLKSTTTEYNDLDDREEINLYLHSRFAKSWGMGFLFQRDLKENHNIEIGGRLYYDDECFQTGLEVTRNFTHDRDYSDGLSIKYNIVFKGMSNFNNVTNFEGL